MILGAARGAAHLQCYLDWKRTIAAKEDILSKRLLEALQIWYAKFPSSKKRGRSLLAGRPPDSIERGLLSRCSTIQRTTIPRTTRDLLVEPRRGGAGAAPPAGCWGAQ